MAAKPKYNAPYHDNWAWSLAAMGATNEEIALAMGVSERTIMRWAKEHESFGKALGEGKGVSDAKVIRSLYERATGYEYEEEKKIIEYDKDGNVKPVKIEKTKKHVPPDVTAQIFWLKNRQPEKWRDRKELQIGNKLGDDLESMTDEELRAIIRGEKEQSGNINTTGESGNITEETGGE